MNKKDDDKRKQRGKEIDGVIFPLAESSLKMPETYPTFIKSLKEQIQKERLKTVLSANKAMILMYWQIGKSILDQQNREGWDQR